MKKTLAILLLSILLFTTACGGEVTGTTPSETTPAETEPTNTTPAVTTPVDTRPAQTTPSTPTVPEPVGSLTDSYYEFPHITGVMGDTIEWRFSVPDKDGFEIYAGLPDLLEIISIEWEEWDGYFDTATVKVRILDGNRTSELIATDGTMRRCVTVFAEMANYPIDPNPTATTPAETTPAETTPAETTWPSYLPEPIGSLTDSYYEFPYIYCTMGDTIEWRFSVPDKDGFEIYADLTDLLEIVSIEWEEWDGYFDTATVKVRVLDGNRASTLTASNGTMTRCVIVQASMPDQPIATTPAGTTPAETTRPSYLPEPEGSVEDEYYTYPSISGLQGETVEWKFSVPEKKDFAITVELPDVAEIVSVEWEEWEGYFATATVKIRLLAGGRSGVTATDGERERIVHLDVTGVTPPETLDVLNNATYYVAPGTLLKDISADKLSATVYYDDTTVTYTIITDRSVDTIEIAQVANGHRMVTSPKNFAEHAAGGKEWNDIREISVLTFNGSNLTSTAAVDPVNGDRYTASKSVEADRIVWTISVDFGYTAVEYVRIRATDTETASTHEGYTRLDIQYPTFEADTAIEQAIYLSIQLNLDETVLFQVDKESMSEYQKFVLDSLGWMFLDEQHALYGFRTPRSEMLAGSDAAYLKVATLTNDELYSMLMQASPIWKRNFTPGAGFMRIGTLILNTDSTQLERNIVGAGDKLISNDSDNRTFYFYCPITVETRAIVAYLEGYTIDAEKFFVAHSVYTNAVKIIEEVIEDGMTDFEKARALYKALYDNHVDGPTPLPDGLSWDTLVEGTQEHYDIMKTAYGVLNGYGGDCSGWTGAYFTLCNMVGVPCIPIEANTVRGSEVGGPIGYDQADHILNLIQLDGEYYYVDAFWSYQGVEDGIYYDFLKTDKEATLDYQWLDEDNFGPPACNYTTYLVDPFTGELLKP